MVLLKQAKHQNWKVNKGEKTPRLSAVASGAAAPVASGCFLLQVRGPLTESSGTLELHPLTTVSETDLSTVPAVKWPKTSLAPGT